MIKKTLYFKENDPNIIAISAHLDTLFSSKQDFLKECLVCGFNTLTKGNEISEVRVSVAPKENIQKIESTPQTKGEVKAVDSQEPSPSAKKRLVEAKNF